MSSSSSVIEGGLGPLLAESFRVLACELPAAHARLCFQLSGQVVELQVDGEPVTLSFASDQVRIGTRIGEAPVRIATSRQAILAVLDARLRLREAVHRGAVEVVGPLAALAVLHGGLHTYVHGAVRCPSFPSLLERFRASCLQGELHE